MCLSSCNIRITRLSRRPNQWLVARWIGLTNISDPPEQLWITDELKPIFDNVQAGNAISMRSTGVTHFGICAGKNSHSELMIIHRTPSEPDEMAIAEINWFSKLLFSLKSAAGKWIASLFGSGNSSTKNITSLATVAGGITVDKLIEGADLMELVIYQCHPGMADNMCRAATLHRAFTYAKTHGYNPFDENCENFVAFCCLPYPTTMSAQVVQQMYIAASGILVLASAIIGGYSGIGWLESFCLTSCMFTVAYLGYNRIWKFIVSKYVNRNLASLDKMYKLKFQHQPYLAEISQLADRISNGEHVNEQDLIEKEQQLLNNFYYLCQTLNFQNRDKPEKRPVIEDYACIHALVYLPLRCSHVTSIIMQNMQLANGCEKIFEAISAFFVDLKAFSMALGKIDSVDMSTILKQCMYSLVIHLVGVLNPKVIECWWAEENVKYALDMCQDVGRMMRSTNISKVIDISMNEKLFECLHDYWMWILRCMEEPGDETNGFMVVLLDQMIKLTRDFHDDEQVIEILQYMLSNLDYFYTYANLMK